MRKQAIALCRVSTSEQKQNNSLNRQEESVLKAANDLGVEVVKWWSGDISSKAGTNVKRKDLNEMLEYCKHKKSVKYLIVDEPDRFMRSVDEAFYFEVAFKQLGVKVWYASDANLNTDDLMSKMLKFSKYFPAEGSNLERQTKSITGHQKAIREGRYTFPPKPGYRKGEVAGVHVPHAVTFELLKNAFRDVLSGLSTPTEALKKLNNTDFVKVHAPWSMDKFRHFATDPYYAGILVMDKQVKERNECGQHQIMVSREEHEELVRIFNGSLKLRGAKKQYNPEFPMNKIMTCEDCGGEIKFTGSKKSNGYAKKITRYYMKYHCRGCGRAYHRDDVHTRLTERMTEIRYEGNQAQEFSEALEQVWRQKQQDKLQESTTLQRHLEELEGTKSSLVIEMAKTDEESLKEDFKAEVGNTKDKIEKIKARIDLLSQIDDDLKMFVEFGITYTDDLMNDWWDLSHEDRVRCQQLIFPGGIMFNSRQKVGTPLISPIYSLKPNKKDLSFSEKSHMVELVGTAPTSAGLSWLVVYRCSSFCKS